MSVKWFVVVPSIKFIYAAACCLWVEVLFYLAAVDGGACYHAVGIRCGVLRWCYLLHYIYGIVGASLLVIIFSYFIHIGLVFRWSFTNGSC